LIIFFIGLKGKVSKEPEIYLPSGVSIWSSALVVTGARYLRADFFRARHYGIYFARIIAETTQYPKCMSLTSVGNIKFYKRKV